MDTIIEAIEEFEEYAAERFGTLNGAEDGPVMKVRLLVSINRGTVKSIDD